VTPARPGRIAGIDAARATALVGMFATHLLPLADATGGKTLTGLLADGRASALFAVLAGVGVALSTGGAAQPADARSHAAAAAGLVVRGVLVGLIGLLLGGLDPAVAVILAYYGLLFVLATPLLRLGPRPLAALAAAACLITPVVSQVLRAGLPEGPGEQPGLSALAAPGDLLVTLGLTGYYPVWTWLTYLLAGMAVGRLDLTRPRVAAVLLGGGAVLAVTASVTSAVLVARSPLTADALAEHRYGTTPTGTWWWLAVDLPHSGAPLDLAGTAGSALAVLGAMLLIGRWAAPLLWLPAAMGAFPLTAYTLHVLAVAGFPATGLRVWLAHVVAVAVLGALLRLARRRGPLEALVAAAAGAARRAASTRPPARF
jgi:Heparan-alpha-glucosaminide N-acetyltransferase, catalytic